MFGLGWFREPKPADRFLIEREAAMEEEMGEDKEYGEGNYKASREYDEAVHATAKDQGKVKKAARKAEEALDTDEAAELEQAETEGLSHAKH